MNDGYKRIVQARGKGQDHTAWERVSREYDTAEEAEARLARFERICPDFEYRVCSLIPVDSPEGQALRRD
jgi:hypothetical protein